MPARKSAPQIHVYHATAPTCWWSWGYEAVLNRIPLVYGKQVKIHLLVGCVYEDIEEWMRNYEMTIEGQNVWAREAAGIMGVPIRADYSAKEPKSVLPATFAVVAAKRQGEAQGARFMRSILRRFCVEGQDVTRDEVLREAAKEAKLDADAFFRDYRDTEARREELGHQGHGFPHVPLGFYSMAVTDGGDRTVLLDYAFDPAVVEGAIDYLAGGRLPKRTPTDVVGYVRHHGATPLREIARVVGCSDREAKAKLDKLVREGRIATVRLAGAPHWYATRG
jgi:protein-disulfide isomerase-like protein with CxxC motif